MIHLQSPAWLSKPKLRKRFDALRHPSDAEKQSAFSIMKLEQGVSYIPVSLAKEHITRIIEQMQLMNEDHSLQMAELQRQSKHMEQMIKNRCETVLTQVRCKARELHQMQKESYHHKYGAMVTSEQELLQYIRSQDVMNKEIVVDLEKKLAVRASYLERYCMMQEDSLGKLLLKSKRHVNMIVRLEIMLLKKLQKQQNIQSLLRVRSLEKSCALYKIRIRALIRSKQKLNHEFRNQRKTDLYNQCISHAVMYTITCILNQITEECSNARIRIIKVDMQQMIQDNRQVIHLQNATASMLRRENETLKNQNCFLEQASVYETIEKMIKCLEMKKADKAILTDNSSRNRCLMDNAAQTEQANEDAIPRVDDDRIKRSEECCAEGIAVQEPEVAKQEIRLALSPTQDNVRIEKGVILERLDTDELHSEAEMFLESSRNGRDQANVPVKDIRPIRKDLSESVSCSSMPLSTCTSHLAVSSSELESEEYRHSTINVATFATKDPLCSEKINGNTLQKTILDICAINTYESFATFISDSIIEGEAIWNQGNGSLCRQHYLHILEKAMCCSMHLGDSEATFSTKDLLEKIVSISEAEAVTQLNKRLYFLLDRINAKITVDKTSRETQDESIKDQICTIAEEKTGSVSEITQKSVKKQAKKRHKASLSTAKKFVPAVAAAQKIVRTSPKSPLTAKSHFPEDAKAKDSNFEPAHKAKYATNVDVQQFMVVEAANSALKQELQTTNAKLESTSADLNHLQNQMEILQKQLAFESSKALELPKATNELSVLRSVISKHEEKLVHFQSLQDTCAALETRYKKEYSLRRKYYNEIEDLKGKIRVYARCRPMAKSEIDRGCDICIRFPNESKIELQTSRGPKEYVYDQVFDLQSTQEQVFEDTQHLMQSTLDGYNVCIFAYGQTGSGKTFTMTGNEALPGLTPRAIARLFALKKDMCGNNQYDVDLQAYMVELYNDSLIDLFALVDNTNSSEKLEIKKNDKGLVYIQNITMKTCDSAQQTLKLFEQANKRRQVGATKMNSESSRSHCVLSILVTSKQKDSKVATIGKLSLVDLAGSERAGKTGATADRLKEAQAINKSLSALGDVISALSSNEKFIPYRNNKLTQLMQDSLGGNAKTLMFVNISPADYNQEETQTSLQYASRVKAITNNVSKNSESETVQKLKTIIRQLRAGKTDVDCGFEIDQ